VMSCSNRRVERVYPSEPLRKYPPHLRFSYAAPFSSCRLVDVLSCAAYISCNTTPTFRPFAMFYSHEGTISPSSRNPVVKAHAGSSHFAQVWGCHCLVSASNSRALQAMSQPVANCAMQAGGHPRIEVRAEKDQSQCHPQR